MKNIILTIWIFSLMALNSCKTESKKKIFDGLTVYTGENFDKNSIINILGTTEIIKFSEVQEFVNYRESILRGSNLNFKEPITSMTVKELKQLAASKYIKEEVIFIFGITKDNNLNCGVIGSLGYPIDNNKIRKHSGHWLNINDSSDSLAYEKHRAYMIKNKIDPYINYQDRPFVSLSKWSIKYVIHKMIKSGKWNDNMPLYFHYGYSKNNDNKYHVAILFTPLKDLSDKTNAQVGFANRNGTCCPPDN